MLDDQERREMLREIYTGAIDNWYDEMPEVVVTNDVEEFVECNVWQDTDTGKWVFYEKEFSRKGQAEKAARLYFSKKKI